MGSSKALFCQRRGSPINEWGPWWVGVQTQSCPHRGPDTSQWSLCSAHPPCGITWENEVTAKHPDRKEQESPLKVWMSQGHWLWQWRAGPLGRLTTQTLSLWWLYYAHTLTTQLLSLTLRWISPLSNIWFVPDTIIGVLHVLTHLIFIVTLLCIYYYEENWDSEKLSNCLKVT